MGAGARGGRSAQNLGKSILCGVVRVRLEAALLSLAWMTGWSSLFGDLACLCYCRQGDSKKDLLLFLT
jgi:hypothetical protein